MTLQWRNDFLAIAMANGNGAGWLITHAGRMTHDKNWWTGSCNARFVSYDDFED
jgi:hypothetical protein